MELIPGIEARIKEFEGCCGAITMAGLRKEYDCSLPYSTKRAAYWAMMHNIASRWHKHNMLITTDVVPDKIVDMSHAYYYSDSKHDEDLNIYDMMTTLGEKPSEEIVNSNTSNTIVSFTVDLRKYRT